MRLFPIAASVLTAFVCACGDPSCPPTEPERWTDCLEGDRTRTGCAIVHPVETGVLTATDPSFTCELDGHVGPSACDRDLEPELYQGDDGGSLRYPVPGALHGSRFQLQYARSADGTGMARFCRVGRDDVGPGGDCWPADWECATAGSVTLDENDDGAPSLEFIATFSDGGTVTGAF